MTKDELLEQLRQERATWEALVAEIGIDQMESPDLPGGWTFKDTVAHLTTWWRCEVADLAAARRREAPVAPPSQNEVQIINQWIYLTNRERPLQDVLNDAKAVWDQFESLMVSLTEKELMEPGTYEWLEGQALGPKVLQDYVSHLHEEHEPAIRNWMQQGDSEEGLGLS